MGQKTHPKGFRLVTTQNHLSSWYSNKLEYSLLIEEDFFIRSKVEEFFSKFLSISKIEITRINSEKIFEFSLEEKNQEQINLTIHALFPRHKDMFRKATKYFNEINEKKSLGLLNSSKSVLKRFTSLLLKRTIRNFIRLLQLKTKKNYYINLKFLKNPFEDATLIAKFIAEQLEKRVPFRRAVKQTIKKVKRTTMKGVKVQVSGRLNGIDMARSEWKRNGKVPLHTLNADIDYTHQIAQTVHGVIGIKVWLFKGN